MGACLLWLSAQSLGAQLVTETIEQRVRARAAETAANPFLGFLPRGVVPDYESWRRFVGDLGALRSSSPARAPLALVPYSEAEAVGGVGINDFDVSAEWLPRRGDADGWRIVGRLDRPPTPLALVGDVGGSTGEGLDLSALLAGGARRSAEAIIGDGPFGSAATGTGDFDVFCFDGLAGQTLVSSVSTPPAGEPGAGLDAFLALFDGAGNLIAFEDEIIEGGFFVSTDARMNHRFALDDRYCLFVGGSRFDGFVLPADPDDAGSGPGVVSEGDYRLDIAIDPPDRFGRDLFAFSAEAGDVIGATLREGARHRIGLFGADGDLQVASSFDLSGLYPAISPLPSGGSATVAYVMPRTETVFLSVEADSGFEVGDYEVDLALFRPGGSGGTRGPQNPAIHRIVLEFEGGEVDRSRFFGGLLDPEPVQLSPMASFLGDWGLGVGAHDILVDRIVAVARAELEARIAQEGTNGDWRGSGNPGEFGVEVVGGPGIVARPGDVRLVIGGTIDELRLQTIGIAEAIDPGNFEKTKLAVVLLDLLSAPAGDPNSINGVALAPGASKLDLIGVAVGRIAAHEAGHLLGNFHTERDLGPTTIMDSGGRLDRLLGLGDDTAFGSEDDVGVHLGPDEYSRREPFTGLEPTLNVLSHGLPVGIGERVRLEPGRIDFGAVPLGSNRTVQLEVRNEGTETQTVRFGGSGGCGLCPVSLSTTSIVLGAGERGQVDVTFAPFAAGPVRFDVPVEVDGSAGLAVPSIETTGVGLAGGEVVSMTGLPALAIFPPLIYPGPADSVVQLRLQNTGDVAVRPALRLQGPQADRFHVDGADRGLDQDLSPGETITFDVVFDPAGAVGEARASLFFLDVLRAAQLQEIQLAARSDGPDLVLAPRPYSFGALRADGGSGRRSFRIENRGTRPLRLTSVMLGLETPPEYQLDPPATPRNVAPGATVLAPVVFTPSDALLYRGELRVATNDPDEPLALVEMFGFGLLPMIEVWPTSVRLAAVPPGTTVDGIVVRITNVGGATLSGSIELEDPSGVWTLTPPPGDLRIAPESEIELLLSYTAPGARGLVGEATLVIRSDDRDRPEWRVPLIVGSVLEIPSAGTVASMMLALLLALLTVYRLRS